MTAFQKTNQQYEKHISNNMTFQKTWYLRKYILKGCCTDVTMFKKMCCPNSLLIVNNFIYHSGFSP